jgi:hypothetical protein
MGRRSSDRFPSFTCLELHRSVRSGVWAVRPGVSGCVPACMCLRVGLSPPRRLPRMRPVPVGSPRSPSPAPGVRDLSPCRWMQRKPVKFTSTIVCTFSPVRLLPRTRRLYLVSRVARECLETRGYSCTDVLHAQRERSTHQKRTRTPKHTCQRSVYSRNTLSPRPQSVHASDVTGPHKIARNNAPQSRHTVSLGRFGPALGARWRRLCQFGVFDHMRTHTLMITLENFPPTHT